MFYVELQSESTIISFKMIELTDIGSGNPQQQEKPEVCYEQNANFFSWITFA